MRRIGAIAALIVSAALAGPAAAAKEGLRLDYRHPPLALALGAPYVSTDYRHPDKRFSDYEVRLPDGAITVCNPQRAPERCAGLPVEPTPGRH